MKKVLPYQILVSIIHEKKKKKKWKAHTTIIKFEISAPTWNDEFELPGASYFISDIQDYLEYILKKHNENIDMWIKLHLLELHLKLKYI